MKPCSRLDSNAFMNQTGYCKQKGDPLMQVMFALMICLLMEVLPLQLLR
jgi:hypothetical protein